MGLLLPLLHNAEMILREAPGVFAAIVQQPNILYQPIMIAQKF
jgi:hypothetical protein